MSTLGASTVRSVAIVGAGIGGIALALALQKVGITCTIYEQASELKEVGSGVGLWCNAVRVLHRLGLAESLERIGRPMQRVEVNTRSGTPLNQISLSAVAEQYGGQNYIVHRAELHRIMVDELQRLSARAGAAPLEICLNTAVDGLETIEGPAPVYALRLRDGRRVQAELIVGCDGIHSRVREALWGAIKPDYSGETCWRLLVEAPGYQPLDVFREIQGVGLRAGICPLPGDRLYLWLTAIRLFGEKDPEVGRVEKLAQLFAGWPFELESLIRRASPEQVLRTDLCDRPPLPRWHRSNVTLLGDAAHPTTPNLGMGACMAIEDGMVLTRSLLQEGTLEAGLEAYERERLPRTSRIVRLSRFWGKTGQWQNPVAVWLREANLRWMPEFLNRPMFDFLYGYDAGRLPEG